MDLLSLLAGITSVLISVLLSIILIYFTFKFNVSITSYIREEDLILKGNSSVAVVIGSILISQSILLRHALFPTMVVLRNILMNNTTETNILTSLLYCLLFFLIIGSLSILSVLLSAKIFSMMTRNINEKSELHSNNIAIAILFSSVLIAITLIVDSGIKDLAISIIPLAKQGIISLN